MFANKGVVHLCSKSALYIQLYILRKSGGGYIRNSTPAAVMCVVSWPAAVMRYRVKVNRQVAPQIELNVFTFPPPLPTLNFNTMKLEFYMYLKQI